MIRDVAISADERRIFELRSDLAKRYHPCAPAWFAPAVAVIIDGGIVQCTIFNSTAPADAARSAVRRLIETALA